MTKLFDSMAHLKFKQDDAGNDTKVALGMHSKDGEYVDLDQPCDLGGQVQVFHYHSLCNQRVNLNCQIFPVGIVSISILIYIGTYRA